MWPNDRQQTGRKFATCRQILVAKAKILVANAPVSVAISSPAFYLHPVDLSSSDTLHVASFVSNKFLRR